LVELSQLDFFEIYPQTISRIARKVVYHFLAKVCLPVSGYRNFRSWLNRKMFLAKQKEKDEEVVTELEEAVKEIERIWNSQKEPDSVAKIILEKYNLIKEYIDSSLSKREFCKAKHIGEVRFNEELRKAKEEYVWLSSVIS
jgi:pyrroloquinoline quinone (PQQ) biosynthesis protein C